MVNFIQAENKYNLNNLRTVSAPGKKKKYYGVLNVTLKKQSNPYFSAVRHRHCAGLFKSVNCVYRRFRVFVQH